MNLWLALTASFVVVAAALVGLDVALVDAGTIKRFSALGTLMAVAYLLGGLAVVSFGCAMFEVPLPGRTTRLRLPRRHKHQTPEIPAEPLPDAEQVTNGFVWLIDQVERLPAEARQNEGTARGIYDSRLLNASLQLFDSAYKLGYSPRADRAKIEKPMTLVDNMMLLSLLCALERFTREQIPPPQSEKGRRFRLLSLR